MSKLVYLGTSGAMPTKDRGLSCTVLALDREYIMVDCGDGSCRQYVSSNLKWNKPLTIFITHMHSDHTMGIMGLLQSMDLQGRTEPVLIYGVKGLRKFVMDLHRGANFKFGFDFEILEIDHTSVIKTKAFKVECCKTKHQVPSLAYKVTLPEKEGKLDVELAHELGVPDRSPLLGKLKRGEDVTFEKNGVTIGIRSNEVVGDKQRGLVIGFSGDTRPIPELIPFFEHTDYLTFETTFRTDELELAKKAKHSTAEEVGELCTKANVRVLLANHFSARHADVSGFKTDIESEFAGKVILTKDFLEVDLQG